MNAGTDRATSLMWGAAVARARGAEKLAARCEARADQFIYAREAEQVAAWQPIKAAPLAEDERGDVLRIMDAIAEERTRPRPAPRARSHRPNRDRERRYVEAALDGELARVASAPDGCRNVTLFAASAALGSLVGAGMLDEAGTAEALLWSAQEAGLDPREARSAIRSGLRCGARKPRELDR